MPSISVPEAFVAVSAADALGNLTVASTDLVYPGSHGWLTLDDGTKQVRVKVLAIPDGTHAIVGPACEGSPSQGFGAAQYIRLDVSDYNGSAHLCIETQTAPIEPAYSKRAYVA